MTDQHENGNGPLDELEKARLQGYLDERKLLVGGGQVSEDEVSKYVMTFSSGALALSLVFLEKIAPHPDPQTLFFLKLSWACLVVSLLMMLASFQVSQKAFRRQIEILESITFDGGDRHQTNSYSKTTESLNVISIILFIAGIASLCLFSSINLDQIAVPPSTAKPQPTKTP